MDPRDYLPYVNLAIVLVSIMLAIGAWRGKREAAEVGAARAIEHMGSTFSDRVKSLEQRMDESGEQSNRFLQSRFQSLDEKITKLDSDRRNDFDRLHAKADRAQQNIAENWRQAQKDFVSRSEHEQLLHTVYTLETRLNTFIQASSRKDP